MNKPGISVSALLGTVVSESELADGRTVQLCRDANGNYWVVDGAERVVSLDRFAAQGSVAAREFCALARAETVARIAARTKEAFSRVAKALDRTDVRVVHARPGG